MTSFGQMLKAGRTKAGLTQRELADALDRPHTVVSHWEHDRLFPNLVTTVEVADFLELDLAAFIRARYEAAKARATPEERAAEQAAEATTEAAQALAEPPRRRRRGAGQPPSR